MNGMPLHWARRVASVSPTTLDSEEVVVGRGEWSSSTGAYQGGACSKSRPSVVSLEAHTTFCRLFWIAARKTLLFIVVLTLNVRAGVNSRGAGMLARWTTASTPLSSSTASP